ncbi:MAG: nuclear transport factor 2 family protein [Deltaproteobacteria bacterium]|nr:nuclear transport factor 2 family protein [Deltaproteobacteria bacterium]
MSNLPTIQSVYEAFGRGDVPAILETLDDDVSWEHDTVDHGIPWFKPGRGKDHVGSFFQSLAALDITNFEVRNLFESGDQVMALVWFEGTVKDTGKGVKMQEAHLWSFNDTGKVATFAHIADTHQFVTALQGA